MACAARPLVPAPVSLPPVSSRSQGRARGQGRQLAARARHSAQEPFPFLAEVPTREARRQARAHRPHLRPRTVPGVDTRQQVLPFRRSARESLLTPELAEAMETALAEVRSAAEGGRRQRAAESLLLQLLAPFLKGEVAHAYSHHERTHLEKEDLLQEARLRAQKLWKRFKPGWAGPGRTLYPAYVMKAVRQHLGNVLAEARLVGPTQWGRKLAARARRRVASGEASYEEALKQEGADDATALGLTLGATRASEREYLEASDDSGEDRERLALGLSAAAALKKLPRRERLAVAVPLGLTRKKLSDAQLARQLGCTPEEVLAARARGLATLREYMHGRVA